MSTTVRLVCLALLAACLGCPGSLDDPERFMTTTDGAVAADGAAAVDVGAECPDVPSAVFVRSCALSGCHSASDKANGLDLQSPDVGSRLLNAPATGGPGLLVDSAEPPHSVVYTKLTPAPPFGQRMPFGAPPLDDTTLACVLAWVSSVGTTVASSSLDGGEAGDAGALDGTIGDDGPDEGASMADGTSVDSNGGEGT